MAALSAVLLIVAAGLYGLVRIDAAPPAPAAASEAGSSPALPFAWRRRIRVTVGIAATTLAMAGFTTAALYETVRAELHLPTTFLGVLTSAQGGAAVVGGFLVGALLTRRGTVVTGALGILLFAAGCAVRSVPWWPATIASSLLIGLGMPWTLVAALTAVQQESPPTLVGRVAATANTAMFAPVAAAIPLGSAAVALGSRPPLLAAAAICLVIAALAWRASSDARPPRADEDASPPQGIRQ